METNKKKKQVLVIVEGAKTDVTLISRLFNLYGLSEKYTIVSYKTNIYDLYQRMFKDMDPQNADLLQVLKEHEQNQETKLIFDNYYSDILLIFDFDPQDNRFSPEAIKELQFYFNESTENGKLYINYPMVEAFYHFKSIPDNEFNNRTIELKYLSKNTNDDKKTYKQIVNEESFVSDYSKFPKDREESNIIIKQNIDKANFITNTKEKIPDLNLILNEQLSILEHKKLISVLSTCVFYIPEYNSTFITTLPSSMHQ